MPSPSKSCLVSWQPVQITPPSISQAEGGEENTHTYMNAQRHTREIVTKHAFKHVTLSALLRTLSPISEPLEEKEWCLEGGGGGGGAVNM